MQVSLAVPDFVSGLGPIPDPVDNMRQAIAFKVGLAQKQAEIAQANAQAQEVAQKLNRAQMFQQALSQSDGSPASVASLMRQFPEVADKLKASVDVQDEAKRTSDVTSLGEIYSAAQAGNWDVASKAAHARLEADQKAGQADPADQAFVDAIDSNDPAKRRSVLTLLGTHLAAATGPDHFASTFNVLNPTEDQKGQVVGRAVGHYETDEQGNRKFVVDYRDPEAPQYRTVTTTDANGNPVTEIVAVGGDSGTTGRPSGEAQGGFDSAVSTVFGNEGGYNPHDLNGSPTMRGINWKANAKQLTAMGYTPATFKNLTEEDAKKIYQGYWDQSGAAKLPPNMQTPYFDVYIRSPATAKSAWKASGGDPQKFMTLTGNYFQGLAARDPKAAVYADAWANRDKNNLAIATGSGASAAAPSAAPGNGSVVYSVTGTNSAEGGMDPQAIEFSAQQYLTTGQMPTLGMGKAAAQARKQIIERAAQIAGAQGLSGTDFAQQIAHYKAATQALKTLETQAGTIGSNEQTALANGQQFIERSKEVKGNSNYPIVNSISQFVKRNTGDPAVRAMDAAWNTFVTEYAKVVAGSPSGAGTLSDSARHEAMEIMKTSDSIPQKLAVFKQMQADMANRMAAIHGTISSKYDELTTNPRNAAKIAEQTDLSTLKAPSSGSGVVRIRTAAEWQRLKPGTRYIDPTGVARIKH